MNGTLLTSGKNRIKRSTRAFADVFNRSDRPIHGDNGWIDMHSIYPDNYDETHIVNGILNCSGSTLFGGNYLATWTRSGALCTVTSANHNFTTGHVINITVSSNLTAIPLGPKTITVVNNSVFTFVCVSSGSTSGSLSFTSPDVGNTNYGHTIIFREFDLMDNFYVTVRFDTPNFYNTLSQISPVAFVDPYSSDPLQRGFKPAWDISVIASYFQNEFISPITDVLDYVLYYRPLTESLVHMYPYYVGGTTYQEITMAVVNGKANYRFNGQWRLQTEFTPPDYCYDGRPNYVGIADVSILPIEGKDIGAGTIVDAPEDLITGFWAGPCTTDLYNAKHRPMYIPPKFQY